MHCVEVCISQEGHTPSPKNISCMFKGREQQWLRLAGLLDSGNLIPGSAAMSAEFADRIGVDWEPYRLEVGTATHGGSLEVVGWIPTLQITVSPSLVLTLTDTIVIRNLSHPLNLSLRFLKDCQAKLDYIMAAPKLHFKGEQISIETQLETLETTVKSEKEIQPEQDEHKQPKQEEKLDLEGLTTQLGQTDLEERTDLPGEGQIPPEKISVFNSLY